MLSIFPIHFLALIAYALLRLCVGFIFLHLAKRHFSERTSLGAVFSMRLLPFGTFFVWYLIFFEFVIGILFILGLFTQIAALLAMALSLKFIVMHARLTHSTIPSRMFYTLLFFTSLSLCITGAGIFAFDLPI